MASDGKVKVQVSASNIDFSVKAKGTQLPILSDVSACVNGGEMLCILGPSGSGKTSLIHIVSQKMKNTKTHTIGGTVLCNGQKLTSTQFRQISGLVTQEDIFNSTLTVRETLSFGASLRLPAKSRSDRVKDVITMLGLDKCAQTKIGDDSNPYLKGISGGEKRRLAIASEILDPDILVLLLDEPTSGLDAAAALNVVKLLRRLADAGMTVITTLHQPRPSIMQHFHKLLVLSEGRTIFHGPLSSYVPYLVDDLRCQIPQHESPYDFLLDILNPAMDHVIAAMGVLSNDCDNASKELANLHSQNKVRTTSENIEVELGTASDCVDKDFQSAGGSRAGCLLQFTTIFIRTAVIKARDPNAMMTQITTAIFSGVLIGAIYWDVYSKEVILAAQDVQMALTMSIVMVAFLPFDVVLTFPKERKIFLRERSAGLYCTSSFFFGRILADMPQHILAAAAQAAIEYPMIGLKMDFASWLLVHVTAILVGASLLQMCGALCRSFEEANIIVMLVMLCSMLVSSSFVREVPGWLEWAHHVSIMALLADIGVHLEFYGTMTTEEQQLPVVKDAAYKLLVLFLAWRAITFIAVKFLHTARTFRENVFD